MNHYLYKLLVLFLITLPISMAASEVTIAHPPKGWECIQDPAQLPQKVKVIYIGTATAASPLNPTLNVACEFTDLTLSDYVALAKSYHEGQGKTHCMLLGKVQTLSGDAELMQIDRPSQWGDVRFIQLMFIRKGAAYVATATCLKKEFSAHAPYLYKALQSISVKD